MTDNDRLNLALELLLEDDVTKYGEICNMIEEERAKGNQIDIYEAIEKYGQSQ